MTRLLAFAAGLVVAFGAAALAGAAIEPSPPGGGGEPGHADPAPHGEAGGHSAAAAPAALPGLASAQAGHRLVLEPVRGGSGTPVRFRIVDARGEAVRDFAVEHDKRMHLIVVRRDLAGFQHLHPSMAPDGTWSARADLEAGGTYRVFADFRRGEKLTLGADVHVEGRFAPRALPAPSARATTASGLEVRLRRDGDRFAFSVSEDGRDVTAELEPYLGARGHLVALRNGDLAYLHTHPHGNELAFETELPTAGRYRLFVQVRRGGRVHTAAFTVREG